MAISTTNPATGQTLKTFEPFSTQRLSECVSRATAASRSHRRTPFPERARYMVRAAEILETEKQKLGQLMTLEMGKPIAAAVSEAEKCATACRYYAKNAKRFLADEPVEVEGGKAWVAFQPMGVVLAIMPWNFPFWQVFRFAAPALMAGNVALLKHASNVPQCALAIEDIFRRAGFPEGVFQTLLIGTDLVEGIIADPRIAAITLTGSEGAGRSVASTAGKHLKKSVVELGGSDPFIVMPSANLERAVATAVTARTINNGQSCIAAKRFIVHDASFDQFRDRFVASMAALVVGDPTEPATQVGPLATESIRSQLHGQVQASVAAGARVLTGGHPIDRPGFYYAPTVLVDIPENSPAYSEELFGPVASLFRAHDVSDAIRIANDHRYGLGSAAWTSDPQEQKRFIDELEAGSVFINGMVASDPRLPFGGVKRSGYGRELSAIGLREFVNIKTVWVGDVPQMLSKFQSHQP